MKDLIKKILKEHGKKKDLIVPYRLEDRPERYKRIIYKKIQDYIKNGSKGDLNLSNTPIDSLPSNLKTVGRNLDLSNTPISNLSSGLTVGGWLDLYNTQISTLPPDLKVGGSLYLWNTQISSLPLDLTVGGAIYLENTPISRKYTKKQIRKMIEDTGGYVKGMIIDNK